MNREPPEIAYAAYIAEGGKEKIPYLLQRLQTEESESAQVEIIDIFTVLAIKGQLHGRRDVVAQLEQVVSKMKYEPLRLKALGYIEEIKRQV
jgi:hypothetical protein